MEIEEMRKELDKCNHALKIGVPREYKARIKERKEQLEMAIWKAEEPENFSNHRDALAAFVADGLPTL